MAENMTRRSHIEVERKFVPTALLQAQLDGRYGEYDQLRRLQGKPKAAQQTNALVFFRLPDQEIKDKYVDYQDQLSKQGVWIRHHTTRTIQTTDFPLVNESRPVSEWQAKLRMGGDYTSSQMLETAGKENMKYVAELYLPGVELKHIVPMAELVTKRRTYVVQKPFGWNAAANQEGEIRVVLDEVTADGVGRREGGFRHEVGEVEITAEVAGGESDVEHDRLRREEMARMQVRLDEFVKRHEELFPKHGVKGKLEAFFDWKDAQNGSGALV